MKKENIHVIACGVLAPDIRNVSRKAGLNITTHFLPGGLHERPKELLARLQDAVNRVSASGGTDRIAIGYGVCGLGTVGLTSKDIPLVMPRVHDCIALFLGSDAAYKEQFAKYPGTYYISAGWVLEKVLPNSMDKQGQFQGGAEDLRREALIEKYGKENADAIEYFFNSWQRNYQRAAFIDTGIEEHRRRYADVAKAMAEEFGWRYEELPGTGEILSRLLTTDQTTDEILVVPPHHVTVYDSLGKGLQAVPIREKEKAPDDSSTSRQLVFEETLENDEDVSDVRLGLGIDAGGTYTDVVIYDFHESRVLEKAKSLTTKWDFTIGIEKAISSLSENNLQNVDLVSVSTTLATNAIVEGRGQKVGLLLMPPYGRFGGSEIDHRPIAVIQGQLDFDGSEIVPIDPGQIRHAIRHMVEDEEVGSIAVAGYASNRNPAHELQVKDIVQKEFGLTVTCGDDVSDLLDYRFRAQTAAFNARIVPALEALLERTQEALDRKGVHAPIMVVKSDGSLMSVESARYRPVETLLSGPAASVAGARFLSNLNNALVVDMGGTTTDTAMIENGVVQICEKGARVGDWQTHVKALDMRTLGLGGDSRILYEKRHIRIGPHRVNPVSALEGRENCAETFDWIEAHMDYFTTSTDRMDIVFLYNSNVRDYGDSEETRILELLKNRPYTVHELAFDISGNPYRQLPLQRLEEDHQIQRAALTPTDLLHVTGEMNLWNPDYGRRISEILSRIAGVTSKQFSEYVLREITRNLAVEILKKQAEFDVDPDELQQSKSAMALLENMLNGGNERFRVRVKIEYPIVGIGAPIHHFLPKAAALLETRSIIPPDADVANAIGAISSSVLIHKQVKISPNPDGRFNVYGVVDAPVFTDFELAQEFAVRHLKHAAREMARNAGTSQTRVEIIIHDRMAPLADGDQQFLGRTLEARLSGRPNPARLEEKLMT